MAAPTDAVRPTSDRVREAMFNRLFSLGALADASVVDAFAGTGALGIEALSRGARRAVFVDSDRAAVAAVRENLAALDLTAEVVHGDALTVLRRLRDVDLVLADPPYDFAAWPELLDDAVSFQAVFVSPAAEVLSAVSVRPTLLQL